MWQQAFSVLRGDMIGIEKERRVGGRNNNLKLNLSKNMAAFPISGHRATACNSTADELAIPCAT